MVGSSLMGMISGTAVANVLTTGTILSPRRFVAALVASVDAVIPVAVACATAGIIIGIMSLTGLGLKFSTLVVAVSGGNLLVALMLTMIA